MKKYSVAFLCFCFLLLLTACGNWNKEEKEYLQAFKFNNEYYRPYSMLTIRKPDKKVGKIDSLVESGKKPEKNNQANTSGLKGKSLYKNDAEPDDLYIYCESPYCEYVPAYGKYIKGIWTTEDMEAISYNACVRYKDKLYLHEFPRSNPPPYSFQVDKNRMEEVGIIDTWYTGAPSWNFATNIYGLLGETLYVDKENPKILYTKYRNDEGEYQEGEYTRYVYEEKKKKKKK